MIVSDRITGSFVAALGAAAAYGGSLLPPVPGQQIGPNVFPIVIGVGLVLCGIAVAFGIGRHFEEEAEADLAAHSEAPTAAEIAEAHSPRHAVRVLIPPALLVFYYLFIDRLGFFLTAAVLVLIGSLALGGRLRLALPIAIIAPVFIHLVFYKLLRVPLPAGLVPMPW